MVSVRVFAIGSGQHEARRPALPTSGVPAGRSTCCEVVKTTGWEFIDEKSTDNVPLYHVVLVCGCCFILL